MFGYITNYDNVLWLLYCIVYCVLQLWYCLATSRIMRLCNYGRLRFPAALWSFTWVLHRMRVSILCISAFLLSSSTSPVAVQILLLLMITCSRVFVTYWGRVSTRVDTHKAFRGPLQTRFAEGEYTRWYKQGLPRAIMNKVCRVWPTWSNTPDSLPLWKSKWRLMRSTDHSGFSNFILPYVWTHWSRNDSLYTYKGFGEPPIN